MEIKITHLKNSKGGTNYGKNDCSVRALANFLDVPYDEAEELILSQTNYRPSRGVHPISYFNLLRNLGMVYVQKGVRLNSKTAVQRLPKKAILVFNGHVCAYEEGVIYDGYNPTNFAGTKQTKGWWIQQGEA